MLLWSTLYFIIKTRFRVWQLNFKYVIKTVLSRFRNSFEEFNYFKQKVLSSKQMIYEKWMNLDFPQILSIIETWDFARFTYFFSISHDVGRRLNKEANNRSLMYRGRPIKVRCWNLRAPSHLIWSNYCNLNF